MRKSAVIQALDVPTASTTCRWPITRRGLDTELLAAFGIDASDEAGHVALAARINERIRNPEGEVTIAIVGKYTGLKDAYKSLIEALSHGGIANR